MWSRSAPCGRQRSTCPEPQDAARIDADPVRCLDPAASAAMQAEVDAAHRDGDTLGGVVEVVAYGLPPGLGSHVHWDRRLDGRLAGGLMSIQAIKGVEVGDGFTTAMRRGLAGARRDRGHGRRHQADHQPGRRHRGRDEHRRAGPAASSHETDLHPAARAWHRGRDRPASPARAINQRSDVTAVPAAGVVAEAMTALVLADAMLEKFGGDSVAETARNAEAYLKAMVIQ